MKLYTTPPSILALVTWVQRMQAWPLANSAHRMAFGHNESYCVQPCLPLAPTISPAGRSRVYFYCVRPASLIEGPDYTALSCPTKLHTALSCPSKLHTAQLLFVLQSSIQLRVVLQLLYGISPLTAKVLPYWEVCTLLLGPCLPGGGLFSRSDKKGVCRWVS